jgi:hypothetical protein
MKKLITIAFSFCLLLVITPALSASASEPTNVNITVVMPDNQPPPSEECEPTEPVPAPITIFPVDVTEIRDSGNWQIIRTYELLPEESPMDIPQGSFERSGWMFTLTDIIRRESANAETREHTETVTLDSATNELAQILALLGNTMEYRSDDGFVGILSLDVSSIKVETAGTRTTSHTMTVTREFTNLSNNDTSLVPKTVTDRGTTYTLANVNWRVGNYSTVDYERIPDYYTAVATYTATGSRTTVTGYTVTAEYSGSLGKLSQGRTTFVAFFIGEEIRTPLEMVTPAQTPEPAEQTDEEADETDEICGETETEESITDPADAPSDKDGAGLPIAALLLIIPLTALVTGGALYLITKKKGATKNEETDNLTIDIDDDGGDSSSGSGG